MMRRALTLLAALLLCCMSAQALTNTDYPVWDGTSQPSNALNGHFGDRALMLEFDGSAEFSSIADGLIEACFFAFDSTEQNMLELYLLMPEQIRPGTDVGSASTDIYSITLFDASSRSEDVYVAGGIGKESWPLGSSVQMHIDAVTREGSSIHVSGKLSALLCRVVDEKPTGETLTLSDAAFDFTLQSSGTFLNPYEPIVPNAPLFTLPPDYCIL